MQFLESFSAHFLVFFSLWGFKNFIVLEPYYFLFVCKKSKILAARKKQQFGFLDLFFSDEELLMKSMSLFWWRVVDETNEIHSE